MQVPEPKSIEIVLFGQNVVLKERTAEERFQLEDAIANRNGASVSFDYIIALKAIECSLKGNILPIPSWFRPVKRFKVKSWNRLFEYPHLKKKLAQTQIEFLLDQIGLLEWGEQYNDIKKKASEAVTQSQEKPSGA